MTINILNFIPVDEHCGIKEGTSDYDCTAAFLKAIELNSFRRRKLSAAGEICFPAGTYNFSSAVDIKSNVTLTSDAGTGLQTPATLKFAKNSDGLRFQRADTIGRGVEDPPTYGAQSSTVRNLKIEGGGRNGSRGSGILMRSRINVENCVVRNFAGHGIEIRATATTSVPGGVGNANGWTITNSSINGCGEHGLYIEGADTNAGYSLRVSATSNGGFGIYDSSFLGNTHVAAHVANNGAGAYFADGRNARNVFVGCYAEEPQRSYIRHPSIVIGGLFGPTDGTGQVMTSQTLKEFRIHSEAKTVGNEFRDVTTKYAVNGSPFTMILGGKNDKGWGYKWRERSRTWAMTYARLDRHIAFHLTTPETGADDATDRLVDVGGNAVGTGHLILTKFLFRNAAKRYEVFEPKGVMERLAELERQVSELRSRP